MKKLNESAHMLAAGWAAMIAFSAGACPESSGEGAYEMFQSMSMPTMAMFSGGGGASKSVSVQIVNGDIRVLLNGEPVPADRISLNDGKLIILDDDGNEIEQLHIAVDKPAALGGGIGLSGHVGGTWFATTDDLRLGAPPVPGGVPHVGLYSFATAKVMLGVSMSSPDTALEAHLGLTPGQSTLITGVYEGLPAHKSGISENDIIVKVNGEAPADPDSIRKSLTELEPGDEITFSVLHPGRNKPEDLVVKSVEFDAEVMNSATFRGSGARMDLTGEMSDLPLRIAVERLQNGPAPEANRILRDVLRSYRVVPGRELFVTPTKPPVPTWRAEVERDAGAPRDEAGKGGEIDERLRQIDERIEKLDQLLQKLLEEQQAER